MQHLLHLGLTCRQIFRFVVIFHGFRGTVFDVVFKGAFVECKEFQAELFGGPRPHQGDYVSS